MKLEQTMCNSCHELIGGKDKAAVVKKSYIQIRGVITYSMWSEKLNRRLYIKVDKNLTQVDACEKCLVQYIKLEALKQQEAVESYLQANQKPFHLQTKHDWDTQERDLAGNLI